MGKYNEYDKGGMIMRSKNKSFIFSLILLLILSISPYNYKGKISEILSINVKAETNVIDDYGNSRDSAASVKLNSVISGSIENPEDVDCFKINIVKQGTIEIFTQGELDTYGVLEDEKGNGISKDDDSGELKNFNITQLVSPGIYYIKIRDFYPDLCGKYEFHVNFKEVVDDYGNSIALADRVNTNTTITGGIQYNNDIDFLKITINQSCYLEVTSGGATDTYGTLYDTNGNIIGQNDDDGPDKNFTITAQVTPGTYFISVRDCYEHLTGSYTLIINEKSFQKDDYSNSLKNAALLVDNKKIIGGIQSPGDVDYFKFIVTVNSNVELFTTGTTDTYGTLFDSKGSIIAKDDDSGEEKNFRIYNTLRPGIYYLEVKNFYANLIGDYSLFLKSTENKETIVQLDSGDSNTCAFEYDGRRYAYIGSNKTPARIIKFDLKEMKRISHIDLPANENRDECRVAALINIAPNIIIHASYTNPCVFTKIDTNTMKITGTLIGKVEDVNDKYIRSMVYDGKYVYAATDSNPAKIIKFDPYTMKRVDSITFSSEKGISGIYKIAIVGNYIVGVCDSVTDGYSKIFRIGKENLHGSVHSIYLDGIAQYHSLCGDGRYVYAATDTNPISVVKIDALSPFMSKAGLYSGIKDIEAGNYSITYDGKNVIVGTWNFINKDKLIKINTSNMKKIDDMDFFPSYPADLTYIYPYIYTCTDNSTGNVVRVEF